jgi:HD superfamily phosphohydrolase
MRFGGGCWFSADDSLSIKPANPTGRQSIAMSEKIIRDPVHDVIAFRTDRPLDRLLFALINTPEFQRLRRIHQLGMASLAYPGADHSRYTHSLGVMETARKMLAQLAKFTTLDQDSSAVCIVAALLHDLGHGPFSHVFERVTGVNHEDLTRRLILDPASDVHRVLSEHEPALPERVARFFSCDPRRTFYCDILASQLDADRFDYLLRDNLMTGSRYGSFDLEWLVHALTIDPSSNRLAVSWKGVSAVEAYLQARFNMYRNVYFHKVVRSAEGMVKLALQRARRLAVQRRLEWPNSENPAHKALLGQQLSVDQFITLDDVSILHCFKIWANSPDPILAQLCRGLLYRQVYKTIDLSSYQDPRLARSALTAIERALSEAGADVAYEIFYDQIADTPYEVYAPHNPDAAQEILVCDPQGNAAPFAQISPLSRALNHELMFRRIHVATHWRDLAQAAAQNALSS